MCVISLNARAALPHGKSPHFHIAESYMGGPGSVVCIATAYGDRIPVRARFSAPVLTGPEAHPASCTMGTGSFPGGKVLPGRDADPSPPSSAEV